MNYQKTRAARLLAVGEALPDVAKVVGKTENTLKMWLLDTAFRKILIDNIEGAALKVILGYFSGEHDNKDKAAAALALLRYVKTAKPGRPFKKSSDKEEDTDLDEFSEESLRKLQG